MNGKLLQTPGKRMALRSSGCTCRHPRHGIWRGEWGSALCPVWILPRMSSSQCFSGSLIATRFQEPASNVVVRSTTTEPLRTRPGMPDLNSRRLLALRGCSPRLLAGVRVLEVDPTRRTRPSRRDRPQADVAIAGHPGSVSSSGTVDVYRGK